MTIHEDTVAGSTVNPDQPILTAKFDEEQLSVENVLYFHVQDLCLYQTSIDFELAVVTSSTEKIAVAIAGGEITPTSNQPVPTGVHVVQAGEAAGTG
ncbi:hypothetical protein [Haloarcula amylovorans]|uniref:hypothetical protein n=1 Tax=Haloarcula amylovorans TaxID=2562280 RepID=UPI001ADDDFB3|nr:hypothetical protein [Halomicroarcula amylolytica]